MLIHRKICDRCGVEYDCSAESEFEGERNSNFQVIVCRKRGKYETGTHKDFCPDCVRQLEEFMRGKGYAHWIYHGCVITDEGLEGVYECSDCHAAVPESSFELDSFHREYCGACGAKMEREEQ